MSISVSKDIDILLYLLDICMSPTSMHLCFSPASLNLSKSPRYQDPGPRPCRSIRIDPNRSESIRIEPGRILQASRRIHPTYSTHTHTHTHTHMHTHAHTHTHTHTHSYVYRSINTETNADYLRLVEVYTAPALHRIDFTPHRLYTVPALHHTGFTPYRLYPSLLFSLPVLPFALWDPGSSPPRSSPPSRPVTGPPYPPTHPPTQSHVTLHPLPFQPTLHYHRATPVSPSYCT